MSSALLYAGRAVHLNQLLTVAGDPIAVRRTWCERLLSRPWRPWQATRTEIPQVPSPEVLAIGDSMLVMHPATWERIKVALAQQPSRHPSAPQLQP